MHGSSPVAHPSSCLKPFFSAGKDQNAPAWPPVETVGPYRGQRVGGPKQRGEAGVALGGTPPGSALTTPQDEENCQGNARCGRGGVEGKGWGGTGRARGKKGEKAEKGKGEKAAEENKEGWGVAWDGEGEEGSRGGDRNHKTLGPFTVLRVGPSHYPIASFLRKGARRFFLRSREGALSIPLHPSRLVLCAQGSKRGGARKGQSLVFRLQRASSVIGG